MIRKLHVQGEFWLLQLKKLPSYRLQLPAVAPYFVSGAAPNSVVLLFSFAVFFDRQGAIGQFTEVLADGEPTLMGDMLPWGSQGYADVV